MTVTAVHPQKASIAIPVLPGQTEAYTDAPIYAQTSGYLNKWYFDIGAKVKAGEVLAEIDTPEVDQELAQAQAQLKVAQAALNLSQVTYRRYQDLYNRNVVAAEDFDTATDTYRENQAIVMADQANINNTGTMSAADGDILVSLNQNHDPTNKFVQAIRTRMQHDFVGIGVWFPPADIVAQILNFGLPAPIDVQIIGTDQEAPKETGGLQSRSSAKREKGIRKSFKFFFLAGGALFIGVAVLGIYSRNLYLLFCCLNTREHFSDVEKAVQILPAAGMIRILDRFEDGL